MSRTARFARAPALATVLATAFTGPACAQADTVRVGDVAKRASGRLVSAADGDTACYLELEDPRGERFTELAAFELCPQALALRGRRVALDYRMANVMAASCQGAPDCRKTERVALVKSVRALEAAAPPAVPRPTSRQASFCTPLEVTVFACRTGARMVSVCASKDTGRAGGLLQYRFGKPDSTEPLELMLPESPLPLSRYATAESIAYSGGGAAWLRLKRGDHAYVVFTGIGNWGPRGEKREVAGLAVERGGKRIAHLPCSPPVTSQLGPEWFAAAGLGSGGEDFELPTP